MINCTVLITVIQLIYKDQQIPWVLTLYNYSTCSNINHIWSGVSSLYQTRRSSIFISPGTFGQPLQPIRNSSLTKVSFESFLNAWPAIHPSAYTLRIFVGCHVNAIWNHLPTSTQMSSLWWNNLVPNLTSTTLYCALYLILYPTPSCVFLSLLKMTFSFPIMFLCNQSHVENVTPCGQWSGRWKQVLVLSFP